VKFKNHLELLESPANGGNMDETPIAKRFSKDVQTYIQNITPSKKLFSKYMYGMDKHVFVVFEDETPIFYILFTKNKNEMHIKNVENLSNIKKLSFNIYSAILNLKLFDKIYTGDTLSTKNIKAHKDYILSGFKMYISGTNELVTKDTFDGIIDISDYKTEFILSNSDMNENLVRTYCHGLLGESNIDLIVEPFLHGRLT